MSRFPRLALSAAAAALTISALAAPVAAADPKVAIVQGMPGVRVDVCVNGKEIKSGMPYGGTIFRKFSAGDRTIKVFKRDARKCRGTKLLQQKVSLAEDADVTLVLTRKAPKLVVFDNTGGSAIYAPDFFFRHAADLGSAVIGFEQIGGGAWTPAAPTTFTKGQQYLWEAANVNVRATASKLFGRRIATSRWVASPYVTVVSDDLGYSKVEFILVGTKNKNARFVTIDRS